MKYLGIIFLLFSGIYLSAQCSTSNPSTDIPTGYNYGLSIEANINAGRRWEESNLGLTTNCLGNLTPPAGGWAALSEVQKALYIIEAERAARNLLPTSGTEVSLNAIAQDHANWLIANNHFSHTGDPAKGTDCSGSAWGACEASWTGSCFYQRIYADPVVGSCSQSIGENIGVATGSTTDIVGVTIYGMMYDDLACCAWGHRNNFLAVFNDNYGTVGEEGFWGIGVAESASYVWPWGASPGCPSYYAKIIVFERYDPSGSATCVFNPLPLPVELVSFTVHERDCKAELMWETATELENDYFSIEKSYDGHRWEAIDQVAGSGTILESQSYKWRDKDESQRAFYRLAQIDFDGKTKHSDILTFTSTCGKKASWYVVQNPFVASFQLKLEGDFPEEVPFRVTSIDGSVIKRGTAFYGNATLESSDWPCGLYFVIPEKHADFSPLRVVKY